MMEDNHRVFKAGEPVALLNAHITDGADAPDHVLTSTSSVGRCLSRLMLFADSLTWKSTMDKYEPLEIGSLLYSLLCEQKNLSSTQIETVFDAVRSCSGRRVLCTVLKKAELPLPASILSHCVSIIKIAIVEALGQGDFECIMNILKFVDCSSTKEGQGKGTLQCKLRKACKAEWASSRVWNGAS
ncbi:hypothetical protein OAN61_00400 [bacterium]|nr:hypothetical protein [bacterium]